MVLDPQDPYGGDPYLAWVRSFNAQPTYDLGSTLGPRGTGSTIDPIPPPAPPPQPTDGGGTRKGGSPSHDTQRVGPTVSQGGELPQSAPDIDAATDTSDPRGDATADELHGGAPDAASDAVAAGVQSGAEGAPLAAGNFGSATPAGVLGVAGLQQGAAGAAPLAPGVARYADITPDNSNQVAPEARPDPASPTYEDWAQQHAHDVAEASRVPSLGTKDLDASRAAEAERVGNMSQEERIKWLVERDAYDKGKANDLANQQAKDRQAEAEQQRAAEQAAYDKAQAQTADAMAQAQRLAATKVVAPHMSAENVVGVILGNMFSGGGPNQALEQWNRSVDRDVDIQKANIVNGWKGLDAKRTLIGDEFTRTGSHLVATHTYMLAAQQAQMDVLQTELQKYNQSGSTAAAIRQTIDLYHQQQAQQAQALLKESYDSNLKEAQTYQALASADKTVADTQKLRAQMAGAGAVAPKDVKFPIAKWLVMHPELKPLIPPGMAQMSQNDLDTLLEQKTKIAGANTAVMGAQSTANATTVSRPNGDYKPFADDKGNPIFIDKEIAGKLNSSNAGAQSFVSAMADVDRMLDEDPSLVDRKAWAALQAKANWGLTDAAKYLGVNFSQREETALKDVTNLDFDTFAKVAKKGTTRAALRTIIDSVKEDTDRANSDVLHTKVSGVLTDVSTAPRAEPNEVDRLVSRLSAQSNDLTSVAQGVADGSVQKKIGADLDRLEIFAAAKVQQHSGRWYLVDSDGHDITSVKPVDTEEQGSALLRTYRDGARAGLASLSEGSEVGLIRDKAGAITQRIAPGPQVSP